MSLYNMMHGVNSTAGIALAMLDLNTHDVPRFRDAYLTMDGDNPVIVIHTRTGGGNREAYQAENNGLTALPGYLRDRDSDLDSTYADFYFAVPERFVEAVRQHLAENGNPDTPSEKWERLFNSMSQQKFPG